MPYRVPFVRPREHYAKYKHEFDAALTGCLTTGDLIAREQLRSFEMNLARFLGATFSVGLNSGYHALEFSLRAAGIRPGDEVLTVAHTFVATVSAIVNVGAIPVLVDVRSDYNMDPAAASAALTPRTRALLPVHLNGRVCDMEPILELARRHNLVVVEDACQALGATYKGRRAGSFGIAGCWSFYPFKMLGCFGDGGAITTSDPKIARAATLLRFNGEDRETGEYHCHGFTALLDNIQAAVLDVKLRYLPSWIEHRRHIADLYHQALEGVGDLRLPHFPGGDYFDVYQNYVVRTGQRDSLRKHLRDHGVETLVSWPKPMWEHPALALPKAALPETETMCREVLSLPMSAETTPDDARIVADETKTFFVRS